MIEEIYGLGAETESLDPEFKSKLFSTKEIDLEGKYINIRKLNGLFQEILDTLFLYYKGHVLDYHPGELYSEGAVIRYEDNLYTVLEETDETPAENNKFKLLTPPVADMIKKASDALQANIDKLTNDLDLETRERESYDEALHSYIEANAQNIQNNLQNTEDQFKEVQEQFSLIREVLKEHGLINDQEDNFISVLQAQVEDIIAVNTRQDTELHDIRDCLTNNDAKNDEQDSRLSVHDTRLDNAEENIVNHNTRITDLENYRSQTSLEQAGNDAALQEYQTNTDNLISQLREDHNDLDNRHSQLRDDHDSLQSLFIAHEEENQGHFETVDSSLDGHKTRLDALEASSEKLQNEIDEQVTKEENDVQDLQNSINTLQAEVTEYKDASDPRIEELETKSEGHETRITSLETRADTNDTDISALRNEDELLRDFLERLEENVGTNNSIITDIQERLEDLQSTTSENNTTLVQVTDDHTTEISQIKEVNNTQDTRLEALETKLASGGLSDVALQQLRTTLKNDIDTAAENTKKGLYEEITGTGKEGEYLRLKYSETNGRNEVESTPLITFAKIATSQSSVDALKLEPVGMSTVFNTWYRFSHWKGEQNISGNTGHDMGGHMGDCPNNWSGWEHETARNKWSYDPNTKMIKSNRNSPVYGAFVSPRKLSNWYLKLLAYGGGDGDNDGILINLAYMKGEDGVEHTIDLVRAVMGKGNGIYLDNVQMRHQWSIVYDYNMNTEFELATNTYIQPKSGGWGTQYCCFSAQRTKTNFKCYTSQIGGRVETVDPKSEISWTLPLTKPSNYSDAMYANLKTMMDNPAQMGVGAHSQNGLFTILEQKYIFDDEKIYDFVSNNIWEYDEPSRLWNSVGKCSDMFDGFVYSRITEDLYYIDNGKAINVNNASTLVTESRVQELIDQLASEVQERDTETLTSSKDYTDTKVQELDGTLRTHVQERLQELTTSAEFTELKARVKSLEDENTELKNRLKTVEDFIAQIEIKETEIDGTPYTLVVVKDKE